MARIRSSAACSIALGSSVLPAFCAATATAARICVGSSAAVRSTPLSTTSAAIWGCPSSGRLRAFLVTHFGKEIVAFVTHPGHLSRADLLSALYGNASAARTVPGRGPRRMSACSFNSASSVVPSSLGLGETRMPIFHGRDLVVGPPGRPRRWRPHAAAEAVRPAMKPTIGFLRPQRLPA